MCYIHFPVCLSVLCENARPSRRVVSPRLAVISELSLRCVVTLYQLQPPCDTQPLTTVPRVSFRALRPCQTAKLHRARPGLDLSRFCNVR